MAVETIKISKQANGTGLYLTDNEGHAGDNTITTIVKPGDTVIWQLVPGGGIDKINGITEKTGSADIFSSDPAPIDPLDPTTAWQGIVSESATGKEAYSIMYTIGDTGYTDDPELELKHG
jgi:hypothetical protein